MAGLVKDSYFMSRVFLSALLTGSVLLGGSLGAATSYASSLKINPYPNAVPHEMSGTHGLGGFEYDTVPEFTKKVERVQTEEREQRVQSARNISMRPMPAVRPRGPQRVDLTNARIEILPHVPGRVTYSVSDAVGGASGDVAVERQPFFNANRGESVEDVLQSWANSEGIGFLWKTSLRVGVSESVSIDEGFETAIVTLLDLYAGLERPLVGQLDTDPVTGVRTLSIATI